MGEIRKLPSGYTDIMQEKKETWESDLSAGLKSWEELYGIKSTYELFETLSYVPFYKYLIRYLVKLHKNELAEENYESIRQLAEIMYQDFQTNGCCGKNKKPVWSIDYMMKILQSIKISDKDFFVLVFGLNMPYEDVEIFLQKALCRTQLDMWNVDEFLMYICCKYVAGNRYEFFQNAKAAYLKLDDSIKVPTFNNDEKFHTTVIKTMIDQFVERIQDVYFNLDEITPEFLQLLREYRYLIDHNKKKYVRTATERCSELLQIIESNLADDIDYYIADYKEARNEHKQVNRYAKGMIHVAVDHTNDVIIPNQTRFVERKKDGELVYYESQQDVSFKAHNSCIIEIPVECTKETIKLAEKEQEVGYVAKQTKFHCKMTGLNDIYNKSGFKSSGKVAIGDTTRISGKLMATCKYGVTIPKGTVFTTDDGRYQYISQNEIPVYASIDVPVVCMKPEHEASVNRIKELENAIPGILFLEHSKIKLIEKIDEVDKRDRLSKYFYTPSKGKTYDSHGERSFANAELVEFILEETKIPESRFNEIRKKRVKNITRNDVLTLSFLAQMSELFLEDDLYDDSQLIQAEMGDSESLYSWRYTEFIEKINEELNACGFYEFYLPNPYECLLAYLTTCDEPIGAFRNLWGDYLDYKETKEKS